MRKNLSYSISSRMRAAVYQAPRNISFEEVETPRVGPCDVLIRVTVCGICGSDVHSYKTGLYIQARQIMGHEFMGLVAAVGENVKGISIGDRVTGFSAGVCGRCRACDEGNHILCPDLFENSTGYGRPGAFAEYVKIENAALGANIHRLPEHLPDAIAATVEPVAVGLTAVAKSGVKRGDKVVVLGGGMIGNACLQAARRVGAEALMIEVSPMRLALAQESGADGVFDARSGDSLEWVIDRFGVSRYHFGRGGSADVVFEAAGSPITIRQSLEMVRPGGMICIVGLPEEAAPIDTTKIVHKLPTIIGSLGGDFGQAIDALASEEIRTSHLISHRFDLAEARQAFDTQLDSSSSFKVMINS
jgi:threonine dehydrogenase-like Zn-dependent dehydrogenase